MTDEEKKADPAEAAQGAADAAQGAADAADAAQESDLQESDVTSGDSLNDGAVEEEEQLPGDGE